MYELHKVTRDGNGLCIVKDDSFTHIKDRLVTFKKNHLTPYFYICNPSNADIDRGDGLTNEEKELLL